MGCKGVQDLSAIRTSNGAVLCSYNHVILEAGCSVFWHGAKRRLMAKLSNRVAVIDATWRVRET